MNEEVLVTVDTTEGKALYFTSNRVIVARAGLGWLSHLIDQVIGGAAGGLFRSLLERGTKKDYSKVSPESIMSASKKNFAIGYTDVTKVEVFKKMRGRKIRITVGPVKHEFWLDKPKEIEKYITILRPVLADKLSVS